MVFFLLLFIINLGSDIMIFAVLPVALIIFSIIHKISRYKRPVLRALITMLSGFCALLAVDFTSVFTGVYIPFSLLSVFVSLIGGLPGVCALLSLNLFF